MSTQEAIETIKVAIAEVEWNYPMNYAAAFEKAISALEYWEHMKTLHDCNDCGRNRDCLHRPKWGEWARINCYDWRDRDNGRLYKATGGN